MPKRRTSRRYRIAGVLLGLIILVAGGSVVYAMTMAKAKRTARLPGSSPAALAAAWVTSEVSRTAPVSCDPVMCRALLAHGFPAGDLVILRPGTSASPLGSQVVVATAALRNQFGSRISAVYAPEAIATFGSGSRQVDIRVIAPHGAAAFSAALSADLVARRVAGAELLGSHQIAASAAARRQLSAGRVDSRVLISITDMASFQQASHPWIIVDFGDPGPGAGAASPLRSVDFAVPASGSAAYVRPILSYLRAQRGVYVAARAGIVRLASGQLVLRIEFPAPSPLGILGG